LKLESTETEPEIAPVPSPYEGKTLRIIDHLALSSFWFGQNFLWGAFVGNALKTQVTIMHPENPASVLWIPGLIGGIPALVIPLIAGPLSDRCRSKMGRRKPYLLFGSLIACLCVALVGLAFQQNNLALYFTAIFLLQIPTNSALAAYSGIIPDIVPQNQRGTASGFMAMMQMLGSLSGVLISAQLVDKGLHNALFWTLGGVYLAFSLFSVFGIRENPLLGTVPKFHFMRYLKSLWIDPRKYPDFGWVWITRALVMMGFYLVTESLLFYFQDVLKVQHPVTESAYLVGIALLMATVTGIIGGRVSDKRGRKPLVTGASLMIGATAVAFLICQNVMQAYLVGVVFGLAYGVYSSVDWALGADVMPNKAAAAKDMAVWHVAQVLPQQISAVVANQILALMPGPMIILAGRSVQTYQYPAYAILFITAAVLFILGGLLVRNVRGVA
jgi:MFS family permease